MKNALIKLHAAVFLWGFTGVLGRLITLNEALLVWYRILITVISLYFLMRWKSELQRVSRKQLWQLFGIGGLIALHWVFFYGSIKYSNVSIALTCLSAAGLFTALLEPVMTRKQIVPAEIILGLVGIAGIYLIFHFDPQYKTGIIMGLLCTLISCIFSILNKKQVSYTAPKTMMLYELSGGFLILTLIMPLYLYAFPTEHLVPTTSDAIWLLLLSWVCTILAMDLSLQALQKVSAFTQNLTLNLEPVYGIVLAFVVYKENEHLSDGFYLGFALILAAVILQMLRILHTRRKEAQKVVQPHP
jgi:drug/metabolite transporter (DMT)-like permease